MGVNSEEGIINVAESIKDNSKFDIVNKDWTYHGPLIMFDTAYATSREIDLANLVKEFYLQDKDASMDNLHDVIDMSTDITFWAAMHW